ncbi:MAG: ATP-binding protein [Clostridia bacterium]|jgi:hypothetical protein|nr:ATP-binding protein [Clostridia bacterium]MDD4275892.1 ATP-binding protein [Clostridia bacterium]
MEIKRISYLNKLINRENNGLVKVITGIRRCGKSYLLFNLYYNYLISKGVDKEKIIKIPLDDINFKELRDSLKLYSYIKNLIIDDKTTYYVFLDEIQFVADFADLINGLTHIQNLDIYVTGSNSKFLSKDILTEFRGRGDEIRVRPLNFIEFSSAYNGNTIEAWKEFYTYGGMPLILSRKDDEQKADYLTNLFKKVYLCDIIERNNIKNDAELEDMANILASSIGSLTNPLKLANTFKTINRSLTTDKTIKLYLDYLTDSFLIEKTVRYDVKGKKYISTPSKYYFADVGLRNATLNFRQQEENHIMENILYNELRSRDYNVDIGVVDTFEKNANGVKERKQLEIDFIASRGNKKYYIQSAFEISSQDKENQEKKSLLKINDSFKKIIIVKDDIKLKIDDNGIITMGIMEFLLNVNSLETL